MAIEVPDFSRVAKVVPAYTEYYHEQDVYVVTSGTTDNIPFTIVPTGEVWAVVSVATVDDDSAPGRVEFQIMEDAVPYLFYGAKNPAQKEVVSWVGEIFMMAGQRMVISYYNSTVGDTIRSCVIGYKLTIA